MRVHADAPLGPKGRRTMVLRVIEWGWSPARAAEAAGVSEPVGPLFCILDGPTRGRPWSGTPPFAASSADSPPAPASGGASHRRLRHAHGLGLAGEGVPPDVIQRQLGDANLGTTSIYLQGIDAEEIIATVHMRRAPTMSASAGLRI